ncbi:MAG: CRISPR-associated endonuclease Cas1 [Candidatus Heimdallarchaeaceae archaeon]
MMTKEYYITSSGTLHRKENTVYFYNISGKKAIPINEIDTLFIYGEVGVTSRLLSYFSKKGIMVHFFDFYGNYIGSFFPKIWKNNGKSVIAQVKCFLDSEKRLVIAKEFIREMILLMKKFLENKRKHGKISLKDVKIVDEYLTLLRNANSINFVRSVEAMCWKHVYSLLPSFISNKFSFNIRIKNPPGDEINAIISFLNSLLYATILKIIYISKLDPSVSFIHEPSDLRYSLHLDIADVYKIVFTIPLTVDLSFKLERSDFNVSSDGVYLNENGRNIAISYFNKMLGAVFHHKRLGRGVSYRTDIKYFVNFLRDFIVYGRNNFPLTGLL